MKQPLTEKLLYVIATIADHNRRCFSWQLALSMSGDPRRYKYRRWLERMLKNKKERQKLYEALYSLKRNKYLQEKVFGDTRGYILTPKGQLKVFKTEIKVLKRKRLPSGQYLMVFFDIPEKNRKARDLFRLYLKDLGFERIQKSVWITPYNIKKELQKLIRDCGVEEYAKTLVVKELNSNLK
jgi:DNA-binding transcriptional regulator PaaX